jgi:hypothetical protein
MKSKIEFKYTDVVIVALAMTIGFCVILMNLTGLWPCQILEATGQHFQIDTLQNSTGAIDKTIYYMHNSLEDLFRCS